MPRYELDHESLIHRYDPDFIFLAVEFLRDEMKLPETVTRLSAQGWTAEEISEELFGPIFAERYLPKVRAVMNKEEWDRRPLCWQCDNWKPEHGEATKPRRPGTYEAEERCDGCLFSHLDEFGTERERQWILRAQLIRDRDKVISKIRDLCARDAIRLQNEENIKLLKRWATKLKQRIDAIQQPRRGYRGLRVWRDETPQKTNSSSGAETRIKSMVGS